VLDLLQETHKSALNTGAMNELFFLVLLRDISQSILTAMAATLIVLIHQISGKQRMY
jgi:hypothetical protein